MRARHRSARKDIKGGVTLDASGDDVLAWAPDVHLTTNVGANGGGAVVDPQVKLIVDGTDGDGGGDASGRDVGNVLAFVTGGDDDSNALRSGILQGLVENVRLLAAEGHVDDRGGLAVVLKNVVNGSVNASDNSGSGSLLALEDLHAIYIGTLGHAVGLTNDRTSHMSTMALAVFLFTLEGGEDVFGTALKLVVGNLDTSVDDVGVGALAGVLFVNVFLAAGLAVGDGAETPAGALLSGEVALVEEAEVALDVVDCPLLVLFDVGNLGLLVYHSSLQEFGQLTSGLLSISAIVLSSNSPE